MTTIRVNYLQRQFGTSLRTVATFTPNDIGMSTDTPFDELLEPIFRTMNCVDGDPETEMCVRFRVRSMMTGDTVTFDSAGKTTTYLCDTAGWTLMKSTADEIAELAMWTSTGV